MLLVMLFFLFSVITRERERNRILCSIGKPKRKRISHKMKKPFSQFSVKSFVIKPKVKVRCCRGQNRLVFGHLYKVGHSERLLVLEDHFDNE